jgi:chromosome partitioning protein
LKTIAIVNQKGGSGKTTTAINLASMLARRGWPTVLIDMDPQSHCAIGLGIPEAVITAGLFEALATGDSHILDRTRVSAARNLELIPSTARLAGIEAARGGLADAPDREERLAHLLTPLADRFAWCIIDCPPSIGLLTFNALRAADEVLIPVETGYFALQGATRQVKTVAALARRTGYAARAWVIATMHSDQSAVSCDVLKEIRSRFARTLCPVMVRLDAALKEAASLGVSVMDHAPDSPGAADYLALAEWIAETAGTGVPAPQSPGDLLDDHADDPHHDHAHTDALPIHVRATTMSRAADLAARTRRLLERTGSVARSLALDGVTDPSAIAQTSPIVGWVGAEPIAEPAPRAAHPAPAPTTPAPTGGIDLARLYGARVTSKGVLFVFPAGPDATVCVASELNGWSATAHRMRYNPAIMSHEICIPMPPGDHRYRLVVDGQWIRDPNNPRSDTNPFGQLDSIITVGDTTP